MERAERSAAASEWGSEFPLIERGLSKENCHAIADSLGLKRPKMYDLGYSNNNCVGCVKGGKGYWNRIRVDFPEVFERRAKEEREVGHSCINGVSLDELDPGAGRMERDYADVRLRLPRHPGRRRVMEDKDTLEAVLEDDEAVTRGHAAINRPAAGHRHLGACHRMQAPLERQ